MAWDRRFSDISRTESFRLLAVDLNAAFARISSLLNPGDTVVMDPATHIQFCQFRPPSRCNWSCYEFADFEDLRAGLTELRARGEDKQILVVSRPSDTSNPIVSVEAICRQFRVTLILISIDHGFFSSRKARTDLRVSRSQNQD